MQTSSPLSELQHSSIIPELLPKSIQRKSGKPCNSLCSRGSFHQILLKFCQNYIKIFHSMKALKLFKSMGMNIYEGKTIEAVQLLELSLVWGGVQKQGLHIKLQCSALGTYGNISSPNGEPVCSRGQ